MDNKCNTNSAKYRQQAYLTRKINGQLDFPQASYTHTGHDLSKKQRGLTRFLGGVAVFDARLRRPPWTYGVGTWTAEIYV